MRDTFVVSQGKRGHMDMPPKELIDVSASKLEQQLFQKFHHYKDAHNLPNLSLITELVKSADMISISSKGICGEDDFRYLWAEEARTHGVNEGDHAGQKGKICSG